MEIHTLLFGELIFSIMAIIPQSTQVQTCYSTNTNFVDLDGDGIPIGQDSDYIKQAKLVLENKNHAGVVKIKFI